MFGHLLVEFLFRLTFGVAVAMGLTRSDQVTSGFFRVHLWVLLGLQTLAALAAYALRPASSATDDAWLVWKGQTAAAVAAAVASYVGATLWMYDARRAGKVLVWLVAGLALVGSALPALPLLHRNVPVIPLRLSDCVSGGALLGFVFTAMLLGHWYLNTPTMQLAPLQRLIKLLAAAACLRIFVCGSGLAMELAFGRAAHEPGLSTWLIFLSLRWLAGIVGVLGLAWMTWLTLKIPNTQSATGLLYAAVILTFIGELTSQLLSAEAVYPL